MSIFYFEFVITTRANPPSFDMDCPSSRAKKRSALFDLSNEPHSPCHKKQSCSQFCDHSHGCFCPAELMPVVPHVQECVVDEEEHAFQTQTCQRRGTRLVWLDSPTSTACQIYGTEWNFCNLQPKWYWQWNALFLVSIWAWGICADRILQEDFPWKSQKIAYFSVCLHFKLCEHRMFLYSKFCLRMVFVSP